MASQEIAHPVVEPSSPPAAAASWVHRFVLPSIADCAFVAVLFWLFFLGAGASALLGDGDTGWHIRAGEWMLAHGQFPRQDLFSFTMQGRAWFAWEWLSDVLFALVHGAFGLPGLVLLAGVVIAATAALTLRYMIWRGVNLLVAILAMLAICSASMVHWLARPHMFTWGFLLLTVWLLEADRRRPSRAVWLLVPLVAVWVNTHGGFAALLVTLGIYAAGSSLEQLWEAWDRREQQPWLRLPPASKRYGALLGACCAATLLNPYGWQLHHHIWGYLGSDFILNNIQEFRSPDFRGESMRIFEVVLLLGVALVGRLIVRREITTALLVAAWAHAALLSVRHVPLFMIVAAPVVAREISLLIEQGARGGNVWLKIVHDIAEDYGGRTRAPSEQGPVVLNLVGAAAVATLAVMLVVRGDQPQWKAEFPARNFPTLAADRLGERLTGRRLLSTDQWGDYLIYRFYPQLKVFIDGRSDFYDPAVRDQYVALMNGKWGWRQVMDEHGFDAALLPASWALTTTLKLDAGWRLVYDDGEALFFERATPSERATLEATAQRSLAEPASADRASPLPAGGGSESAKN